MQTERRARIQKIRLEKGAAKAAEELQKCIYASYIASFFLIFVGYLFSPVV